MQRFGSRSFLLVLVLLLSMSGCGGAQFLFVTVVAGEGLTGDETYTALAVTLTYEGEDSIVEVTSPGGEPFRLATTFSAELPGRLDGQVLVSVVGLDGLTTISTGSAGTTLAGDLTMIAVTMTAGGGGICGNGDLEPPEECDDGNTNDGDGCSSACLVEPMSCGDGVCDMPGGETCANCVPDCQDEPQCQCGNGTLDPGEVCDDGNFNDDDDCPTSCQPAACGDGFLWSGVEECDDPDPGDNLDGCLSDCSIAGPIPAVGYFDLDFGDLIIHGADEFDHLSLPPTSFGSPYSASMASGDVNGDGIADIVVAAPEGGDSSSRPAAGEAYVIFGRNFPPTGNEVDLGGVLGFPEDVHILGAAAFDNLGWALAVGEVTGDAYDDIVIGAPGADPLGRSEAGKLYVIAGGPALSGTIDLASASVYAEIRGAQASDYLGMAVATGPVTSTPDDDVIIGAPYGDGPSGGRADAGEVYVLAGPLSTGTLDLSVVGSARVVVYGADPSDQAGTTVASGNVDGDMFGDLVFGAPNADGPTGARTGAGEVAIYYGSPGFQGALDPAAGTGPDVLFYGAADFDQLAGIATGDLDGDGLDDLLLGARGGDNPLGSPDVGQAFVWLGRGWVSGSVVDAAMGSYELVIHGSLDSTMFMVTSGLGGMVTLADVDASGSLDVVTSASGFVEPTLGTVGAVFAVLDPLLSIGSTSTYASIPMAGQMSPDVMLIAPAGVPPSFMGGPAALGDVNNDGFADFAVGGPYYPSGAPPWDEGGLVSVYFVGPGVAPVGDCFDGADNDGDGFVDIADPGCEGLSDPSELLGTECDDELDNDGDGAIDADDVGCSSFVDDDETDPGTPPECSDGADNDGDGATDFPADTSCSTAGWDDEACGFFGLDGFGYMGCVELGVSTAAMPCEDIRPSGVALPPMDDTSFNVPLPWSFDFYGISPANIDIVDNGKLGFPVTGVYSNQCAIETMTIAPFWDDLFPATGGLIYYQFFPGPNAHLTVQWNARHFSAPPGSALFDFRAVLYPSGDIDFCYVDMNVGDPAIDDGASATIGIAGSGPGAELQFSCNTPLAVDGTVIHIRHP